MTLANVKIGDVVKCDVRGRVFYALVDGKPDAGEVAILPIGRETYYHVAAEQVTGHWRKAGRK